MIFSNSVNHLPDIICLSSGSDQGADYNGLFEV